MGAYWGRTGRGNGHRTETPRGYAPGMSDEVERFMELADAVLRTPAGPPPGAVGLETEDGVELLLHGPGPAYRDHGVMMIPAAVLEER